MRFTFILLCLLMVLGSSAYAQGTSVFDCSAPCSKPETDFQNAIEKTASGLGSFEFRTEATPCDHKKFIVSSFEKTFKKNIFQEAKIYSLSMLKKGESQFSIERFVYNDTDAAAAAAEIISARKVKNLQIESLTYYDFFPVGTDLLILISDRQSQDVGQQFFSSLKENYTKKLMK